MDNIVNLPPMEIIRLAEAATYADLNGYRLRIQTGTDRYGGWVKWDCGRGWVAPVYSREDL